MMPEAGGFYVYARRAFGKGPGFVVGWSDWLNQTASIAYAALTAATFLGTLWPASAAAPRAVAIGVIAIFTALHWVGLRLGSTMTRIISISVGLMLLVLVAGCFLTPSVAASTVPPAVTSAAALPLWSLRHGRGGGDCAARGAPDLRRLVFAHLHGGRKHPADADAAARADRRHAVGGGDVRDHQRRHLKGAAAAGAGGLRAAGRRCRARGAAQGRRRCS